jgi:hypothetical protein
VPAGHKRALSTGPVLESVDENFDRKSHNSFVVSSNV